MPRKPVTRIQVTKSDEIALLIERIIDADSAEVVLTIPRFSRLAESAANFHLMKREADLLNKRVIIESVDDKVIELAENAGLESVNPILHRTQKRVSDIRPASRDDYSIEDLESEPKTEEPAESEIRRPTLAREMDREPAAADFVRRNGISVRKALAVLVIVFSLSGVAASAFRILPRVEVTIVTKKTPWSATTTIVMSQASSTAQVFQATRNLNLSFKATGREHVRRYAAGKITIYNAYSSEAQQLVQRTRFVAPDGKVFRLTRAVTVPGAKIIDGKIVPSSIDAEVSADQPGEAYNIGAVEKFTIPGFQGTPKYAGFYGVSTQPMKGGFIGEAAVPTESDIAEAKETIRSRLQEAITSTLLSQLPNDFKVIPEAMNFKFLKENVITQTDAVGNFSVFAEAELDLIAFREADVKSVLTDNMRTRLGPDYEFKDLTITYGEARANFISGTLALSVGASGNAWRPITADDVRNRILGQSDADLRAYIAALPGFEDGQVTFWPFWVKSVPKRASRVTIDIR